MLFGKRSKKQYLALDIGSQNTKMMVLQPGKAFVQKIIIKPTPPNSFQDGFVANEEHLSDFLTQCAADLGLENKINVVAGISGKGVIAKKIDIPQMDENMIPEFVEIEAEQELFYNKGEMELDYEVLKGVNFDKPEAQSILVITVLKKVVDSYNSIIKEPFMNCEILDTNFAALFNSFEYNENLNESNNYMVLDIGCSSTNLVIVIRNQVVFARHLLLGGNFFNQEIQKKMGVDYQEAEGLKISASKDQDTPQELISLISNELNEAFAEELFSCYELYHSLFPEKNVHSAYITGGASQTFGLIPHLEKKLGFSIKYFNPFQNIVLNSELKNRQKELTLFSAVASGLALWSLT